MQRIQMLADKKVDALVLREKDLTQEEYENLAKKVLDICQKTGTKCILHKYVTVAQKLKADGIHLSVEDGMKYEKALKGFSTVGISTHSPEQIQQAEQLGATYGFYGHVFLTDCKKGVPPRGLDHLRKSCQNGHIPIYAIGGIQKENIKSVIDAGAKGVCIMSLGMTASPREIEELRKICGKSE